MPSFSFFEVDLLELSPFTQGGGVVGKTFEIPSDLYDAVGSVTFPDANDNDVLQDVLSNPKMSGDAEGATITLDDGTIINDAYIQAERTWTLQWDDGYGTQTVEIAQLSYSDGVDVFFGTVAGGPMPPVGVEVTVIAFDNVPTDDEDGIAYSDITTEIACLVRGTLIDTADGKTAVEDLKVGDMVRTAAHGLQPIRWIGAREVSATGAFAPICIREGALGNTRDLLVSPCHRMALSDWRAEAMFGASDVLVTARSLTSRDDVFVKEGGTVEYFHILFDAHEVIFAEGAATESFCPSAGVVSAMEEATRDELLSLFPELGDKASVATALPTLTDGQAELLIN